MNFHKQNLPPKTRKSHKRLIAEIVGIFLILILLFTDSSSNSENQYAELDKKYDVTITKLNDSEAAYQDLLSEYEKYKQDTENINKELEIYKAEEESQKAQAAEEAAAKAQATEEAAQASVQSGVQNQSDSGGTMVWLSETGSKYHNKNNCGNMNPNKAYQVELSAVQSMGYDACKNCY